MVIYDNYICIKIYFEVQERLAGKKIQKLNNKVLRQIDLNPLKLISFFIFIFTVATCVY